MKNIYKYKFIFKKNLKKRNYFKMAKLIEELESKFNNIESRIRDKIDYSNGLCKKQEAKLDENYDIENLLEKYLNELNNQRQLLLNQISSKLGQEIDRVNSKNNRNANTLSKKELKKANILKFKPSPFKSIKTCIRRLINNEYKFGKKISISQLIKYKHILELGQYFKKENN
jgi:hypothetical protein